MENRINKIMELANGNKYIIAKQAIYQNENYYVAIRITDDESTITNIQDLTQDNVKVFKEVLFEGRLSVEEVIDPKLFKLIVKYVGLDEE
ncbi:MAG: hypothetical protein E7170_01050 [Firmicutes bacterium]|nr:hypothetical protein [Bacillota bacterium]